MKKYTDIIVTGSITFDEIMDFPGEFMNYFHPEKLHQINVSFVVDRLEKQLGGIATNIAYNASLLTHKSIRVLSSIGKDGDPFLEFFKTHHIDASGILVDKTLFSSTGKVITDRKDNQIWGFYAGALLKSREIKWSRAVSKNSIVILSPTHTDAFLSAQQYVIQHHIDFIYDPGMAITWIKEDDLREGILHCSYLVGNDYEIAQICKRLNLSIIDILKKNIAVITTLGAQGVQYLHGSDEINVPAYTIKKIIDPTGAGDAWRGGFMAGLIEMKDIVTCLKMGNALASFAVEKYGTVNHKPTKQEIRKRVKVL